MAVSRHERTSERRPQVVAAMGEDLADAALDLFELVELAWHDCYGESAPPDAVVADILVLSGGTLAGLIEASRLAVADWRDARLAADALRT